MVVIGDFTGKYEVAVNDITQTKLLSYITRYEEFYTVMLLGKELYDLWVVDPDAPPFDTITPAMIFQDSNGVVYDSKGIRDMLTGFIYFEYTKDVRTQQTLGGAVAKSNENSVDTSTAESFIWQRYNDSLDTFNAIQVFIDENSEDFPTYKGSKLGYLIPFF